MADSQYTHRIPIALATRVQYYREGAPLLRYSDTLRWNTFKKKKGLPNLFEVPWFTAGFDSFESHSSDSTADESTTTDDDDNWYRVLMFGIFFLGGPVLGLRTLCRAAIRWCSTF